MRAALPLLLLAACQIQPSPAEMQRARREALVQAGTKQALVAEHAEEQRRDRERQEAARAAIADRENREARQRREDRVRSAAAFHGVSPEECSIGAGNEVFCPDRRFPRPGVFRPVRANVIGCKDRLAVRAMNEIPEAGSPAVAIWNVQMDMYRCIPALPGSEWQFEGLNSDHQHVYMSLVGVPNRTRASYYFHRDDLVDEEGRSPWVPGGPPSASTARQPAPR